MKIIAKVLTILMVAAAGICIGYHLGTLDIYRNAGFYIDDEMLLIELRGEWNEVFYGYVEG